jgi:hypothetical protein
MCVFFQVSSVGTRMVAGFRFRHCVERLVLFGLTFVGRFGTAFVVVWSLGFSTAAQAYPVHSRFAKVTYGKSVPCAMCHGGRGGTERNPYGKDWMRYGETLESFKRVESLDSDGDGSTNINEIQTGSNPGSVRSTPQNPGRYDKISEQIQIPSEQLRLVLGRVDAITVSQPDLSDKQRAVIEKGIGRPLKTAEQYPTIYFGKHKNKIDSLALFSQFALNKKHFSILTATNTKGVVSGVIIFRSDDEDGTALYAPFLKCLKGVTKDNVPEPGEQGCPTLKGKMRALKTLGQAVQTTLWTIEALYGKSSP